MKINKLNRKKLGHRKLGFSLIELSIVIVVIGILVLGITKGSAIVTKARIGSARSLTNSSPAAVTSDLIAWYETSLAGSFVSTEALDATAIGTWYDNSPSKSNNAIQSTAGSKPKYYEVGINNLPAVRFDGTDDTMTFDATSMYNNDYTVFVVEQRRAAATGYLVSFGGTTNRLGYSASATISDSIGGSSTVAEWVSGILRPRITTFIATYANNGSSNARNTFVNGTVGTTSTVGTKITFTSGVDSGKIGSDTSVFFGGDIAEIIIYNRSLKLDERNDIQNYLSKKYAIKVTTSAV